MKKCDFGLGTELREYHTSRINEMINLAKRDAIGSVEGLIKQWVIMDRAHWNIEDEIPVTVNKENQFCNC